MSEGIPSKIRKERRNLEDPPHRTVSNQHQESEQSHVAELYTLHQRLYKAQVRKSDLKTQSQKLRVELEQLTSSSVVNSNDKAYDSDILQLKHAISIRQKEVCVWQNMVLEEKVHSLLYIFHALYNQEHSVLFLWRSFYNIIGWCFVFAPHAFC
jgi:hypothetical protein